MMKMMDTTEHLYAPAKAEALAADLQAGDADWTYTVVHDPKGVGYSYIAIYDEDGNFVGKV
jgi:DUF438 domain-containing protein